MKCPNCNAEVTGRFCSYCGSELPRKEPNIHIEHNETIINNYRKDKPEYDDIYEEEKTREMAREKIKQEKIDFENKKKSQGCLVTIAIFAFVVFFLYFKITNWWNDIMESGHEETEKYVASKQKEYENMAESESENAEDNIIAPRESDEIFTLENNVEFWENYSNDDMNRWYKITGRISSINGDIIELRDGLPDNFTAMIVCYFNEGEDLSQFREGDTITFIGFSGNKLWDSLMMEHCFIVNE